jgi:phenylpyruvate tautomerase PptA (4-oxalocrotonate tautomerase family)
MPIIHLHHPAGSLDAEHKAALAHRLTDVLLTMEGGAATEGGRAFASVLFTEVPAGDWWTGGKPDASYVTTPGRFLARVSIPEGYMNQLHKSEVHRMVTEAIVQTLGGPQVAHQGASILVIIEEVAEGNWGAAGQTITMNSIAQSVGLPKDGERFGWVRAYFDAKARQYRAAGYPADAGGLLAAD